MSLPDLLPNRLNFDAVVFCGCTLHEMRLIALCSLALCIIMLSLLTHCLFGMLLIGVGLAFPAALGMSAVVAMAFQKAKQGRPKGYVKQCVLLWCEDHGLFKTPFIRRSGRWSIGRTL